MSDKINIDTRNSGDRGLLRHLIPTAANTGRIAAFIQNSTKLSLRLNEQTGAMQGVESLTSAFVRFAPFLGLTTEAVTQKLMTVGDDISPHGFASLDQVMINKKPLSAVLTKSASSDLIRKFGISLPIADMVTSAWTGQTQIPVAFLQSSPSHIEGLLNQASTSKEEHVVPVPVAMGIGSCACCLSNDYAAVVDNHLKLGDLAATPIVKILKESSAVSAHNVSYQELVAEFLPRKETDPAALMTWLFSTERKMHNMSVFIPVMRLIIPKQTKNSKNSKIHWAISWHCLECVRALFDDDARAHLVARLSAIARRQDMIKMLQTVDRQSRIGGIWASESVSRRGDNTSDKVKQSNNRKSLGRSRGNVSQLRDEEISELITSFVEHFTPTSPEVKQHLFYHKASKTYRIDQKSSLVMIRKIMNQAKASRAETSSLISDIMGAVDLNQPSIKPKEAQPVVGGEEE